VSRAASLATKHSTTELPAHKKDRIHLFKSLIINIFKIKITSFEISFFPGHLKKPLYRLLLEFDLLSDLPLLFLEESLPLEFESRPREFESFLTKQSEHDTPTPVLGLNGT